MQQTIAQCKLCYDKFNLSKKKPIIVCEQKHSICMECLQNLTVPLTCPFCRKNISKETVTLNSVLFKSLGGTPNTTLTFRYLFYKDQLRLMPSNDPTLLNLTSAQDQKAKNEQALRTAKSILSVIAMVFLVFTIINLIVHLCLVFTQEQQCIDWNEHPHTYTIREYLKLNILVNIACLTIAAGLYISQNASVKGFVQMYGPKLVGFYIFARLISEICMWSHFMFVMQPQCSSFIYLYLHVETFGYYLFAFLFTITFTYYCIRKQRLAALTQ